MVVLLEPSKDYASRKKQIKESQVFLTGQIKWKCKGFYSIYWFADIRLSKEKCD